MPVMQRAESRFWDVVTEQVSDPTIRPSVVFYAAHHPLARHSLDRHATYVVAAC